MTSELMRGKRGLVMGVANDHSIAWGIARKLAGASAELAFSYQGEALGKRVTPLAASLGSKLVLPCDVEEIDSVDALFERLRDGEFIEARGVARMLAYVGFEVGKGGLELIGACKRETAFPEREVVIRLEFQIGIVGLDGILEELQARRSLSEQ